MDEAATQLGIGGIHMWLLTFNHLRPVKNGKGEAGVARECVARELEFRRTATRWQRLKRLLKNLPSHD